MAKTAILVNKLFWYVITTTYLNGYEDADGNYVTPSRHISQAKAQAKASNKDVKITVDYNIKTIKDKSTGKNYDKTEWYMTTVEKVTAKQQVAKIGTLLGRHEWYIAHLQLLKDLKSTPEDEIVIYFIPPYIKEVETKDFFRFLFQLMDKINNMIIWKDEDNYVMTHNKKLLQTTKNGAPGFKLTTSSLNSVYNKLVGKQLAPKEKKVLEQLVVDQRFLKNPYYQRLIEVTKRTKQTFFTSLVKGFINASEGKSQPSSIMSYVEDFERVFDMLDVSLDPGLRTRIDKFIFKVYYIAYIRVSGTTEGYVERIREETRAQTVVNVINKVLHTELKLSDVYEDMISIEDGEYIKTDDSTIQLMDNNDPHKNYIEEGEASASPDSPIFEYDYEVEFDELGSEGELI